jgi:hypothetical protein
MLAEHWITNKNASAGSTSIESTTIGSVELAGTGIRSTNTLIKGSEEAKTEMIPEG